MRRDVTIMYRKGVTDLYSPVAMAARLRRVRADVCEELVEELRDAVYSMSS